MPERSKMHDAIQWGTLILVGFGILLNRYDVNGLRKEMDGKLEAIRTSIERQTTTINAMLFKHEERIARVEVGKQDRS